MLSTPDFQASPETQTDRLFPYGTVPVEPAFRQQYEQDYSAAACYPLPDRLPCHHPLLSRLEGNYPLPYQLPLWWRPQIARMPESLLKPLLASVSAHEFRAGCLDQTRWKAFRESLSTEERRLVPTSPKIAALLEGAACSPSYWRRGPVETPDRCDLVISTRPLDFLYMSNGYEWRSCQHFANGCENQHLPGNFYDTGVAVAMAMVPNTHVEDPFSVLVRTTLRVFCSQKQTIVTIGRTYHNNETLAFLFLNKLADLLDERQLSWGFMTEVNALSYCEEGLLGPELGQRLQEEVFAEGELCWFPCGWYVPYVDGGDREWERDWESEHPDYHRLWLSANVKLVRPRARPQAALHHPHCFSQFASAGRLPRLL